MINDGDMHAGFSLVSSFHEMFDGVEKRPRTPSRERNSPRGVPDEDMDVFAEYYATQPGVPSVELGTYVCTGPVGCHGSGRC